MKQRCLITALLWTMLVAAVISSQAAVVTVTPDNMHGWSIVKNEVPEDNATCTAAIANYGYSCAQRNPAKWWVADDGVGLGKGAYYVTTQYGGWAGTPASAWLGLDDVSGTPLAGVALSRISKLEYYAFNAQFPTLTAGGGANANWTSWTYREYPRQPISLQLTAQDQDGNRRQFWFIPFDSPAGTPPHKPRGDNSGVQCKQWLRFDCINFNNPCANTSGRWYCPDPEQVFNTWADLVAAYGSYTLVPTSTDPYPDGFKSAGWNAQSTPSGSPSCTATGMPLNFVAGARSVWCGPVYGGGDATSMINDTQGFRGYMDRFTIGIDGANTTYNFEPNADTPAPRIVVLNNKAAFDTILRRDINTYNPAQDKFLVKVVGKCIARSGVYAYIDDGSATRDGTGAVTGGWVEWWLYSGLTSGATLIRQNPASVDQWWSAIGILERSSIMKDTDLGMPIWTAAKETGDNNLYQY